MKDLTVIILNFNTQELLYQCLTSVMQKWRYQVDVLVVDNASDDGSIAMVKKSFPKVNLLENKTNLGFTGGNNRGIKISKSRYYLLLNSDTIVLDQALDNLIDFMDRSNFAIGSCKILNKNKTCQPNVGDLPFFLPLFFWLSGLDDILRKFNIGTPSFHKQRENFYQGEKEVGWVSGAAMIIKDEVIKKIGFLDEKIFMYGEDVEYCLRASRNCFKVGWTDQGEIIHLGGGSVSNPSFKQWVGEFQGLLYIYETYFGLLRELLLKLMIYFFVTIRIAAFLIIGKPKISQTYGKVMFSIK